MKYANEKIRRQDRLMAEEDALRLLRTGEYGTLSVNTPEGGYGVPVNYVWDGSDKVYIHCALQGRKIDAIRKDNRVTLSIVGKTRIIPERFTTDRECVMLTATAHTGLTDEEKLAALMMLLRKYSPDVMERGEKYAHGSLGRVEIIRLDITEFSGKGKMPTPAVSIDHAALYVRDLEACRDFFVKYFGALANEGYHNKTTNFRSYFLNFLGGTRLEIMTRPELADLPGDAAVGHAHVALSVGSKEQVDALTARLRADSYEVTSGPRTTGDGYYESCVLGPEGIQIEITV
jgi:hypothetical protein